MYKSITFNRIARLAGATVIVFCAVALLYLWLRPAVPGFLSERAKWKKIAPLVSEARLLKISYESVLAYPYQTMGKPVIWCVQNRGRSDITCEGEPDKRIISVPDGEMPLFYGSKHSACADMLLVLEGVRYNSVVSGSTATFVAARYITQL